MFECPTCHRTLSTKRGMRQHHTKVHGESLPNRNCKGCKRDFYDPKADRIFCHDCNPYAGKHNGNWKDAKETANCKLCEAEFEYYPSDKEGVYCPTCVSDAEGILPLDPERETPGVRTSCRNCDESLRVWQHRLDDAVQGVFCDQSCHGEWLSKHVVGETHHQWQGGYIAYGQRWWRMRRLARDRDNHSCQACSRSAKQLGQEPDVHHIVPVREFDEVEDAHVLENLITLCRPCHRQVEAGVCELPDGKFDT